MDRFIVILCIIAIVPIFQGLISLIGTSYWGIDFYYRNVFAQGFIYILSLVILNLKNSPLNKIPALRKRNLNLNTMSKLLISIYFISIILITNSNFLDLKDALAHNYQIVSGRCNSKHISRDSRTGAVVQGSEVNVAGKIFRVDRDLYRQINEGKRYNIEYLKYSNHIVSITELE